MKQINKTSVLMVLYRKHLGVRLNVGHSTHIHVANNTVQ
jgi:hypothetical protein